MISLFLQKLDSKNVTLRVKQASAVSRKMRKKTFSVEQCGYSHQAVCATYTPCKSLFVNSVEMTSPVTIVNSVCEASNLKYCEGWDDCQNACEERSCCIAGENNCRKGNEVSFCFVVFDFLLSAKAQKYRTHFATKIMMIGIL